jgi:curved DNA-binding protein CbpA
MRRDPHDVLGVPEGSSPETIKAVYRQLARTFHPDVNADPAAVEHFREITEAFLALAHPEKLREYRRSRSRRHAAGEETEIFLGLRLAGIDLGGLVGISVVVQRRALLDD